jgi:hypothetical protein
MILRPPSPPPLVTPICPAKPFELPVIKDAKAYHDTQDLLQYYLCLPEYSTNHLDDALVISATNLEASCFWEGQIRVAGQDAPLWFLFKNKGSLYNGKGFKMLNLTNIVAQIRGECCHYVNSLFNNIQGQLEPVLEFHSCFDVMVTDMVCSKIILPPILIITLFLRALHSRSLPMWLSG